MSKMSFLEKIDILFKLSKSSYIYLLIILLLLIFGIIFSTTNRRTINRNKKIYIGFSIFILITMFLIFHTSLTKIFDYMMNNFFIAIYFPNLAIYMVALIVTNIIVWISIFNFQTSEAIKRLNCIIYMIINYLLFLILSIINEKKLDIFTQSSVYGNKKATALIELSSLIFIIWIIFLILYKLILIYIKKDYKPKVKKVVVKKKIKKLPDNYEPTEGPDWLYGKVPKNNNYQNELLLQQQEIIAKELKQQEIIAKELQKQNNLREQYENLLTLEDYKKILKILKERKYSSTIEIEKEEAKPIIINTEEVEYRNKQKQEIIRLEEERKKALQQEKLKLQRAKQELEDKQLKENLTELERLYKGI